MTDFPGRGWVGGGSIAAICGISPFATPLDAYLAIVEPENISAAEREFFDNRKALEPYAVARFNQLSGATIKRVNQRYTDKTFAWKKSELDAETNTDCSVEIKTVREAMRDHWGKPDDGESPPAYVEAQVQWGFARCPWLEGGYVMALIGFDDHRIYEVERNPAAMEELDERAHKFWTWHVEKRRPPAPTTVEDLLKLFPRDSGRKVEAPSHVLDALEAIDRAKRDIRLRTAECQQQEFIVKDFMRDATILTLRHKPVAEWKANTNGVRRFRML